LGTMTTTRAPFKTWTGVFRRGSAGSKKGNWILHAVVRNTRGMEGKEGKSQSQSSSSDAYALKGQTTTTGWEERYILQEKSLRKENLFLRLGISTQGEKAGYPTNRKVVKHLNMRRASRMTIKMGQPWERAAQPRENKGAHKMSIIFRCREKRNRNENDQLKECVRRSV